MDSEGAGSVPRAGSGEGSGARPTGRLVGRLIGVGVGPGDPDLLTRKAVAVLGSVAHVVAPTLSDVAVGRAEAIVREALPAVTLHRMVFPMDRGTPGPVASSLRPVAEWLSQGEDVAFVTLGDPNCYSTFWSVVAALEDCGARPTVETVPGIMAFQQLSAMMGRCLVDGAEPLSVVTALDGTADLERALQDPEAAVVVYKAGRNMPAVAEQLRSAGRLEGSVAGELLGLPGERVGPAESLAATPCTYLATVAVPPLSRSGQDRS
ncbi:MAG: precorrin-2 C(20)-methyltransferase [Actinomycetota bacterium]|nr:precorrin-2 C(20)-methyltransferase [Actinomycetota bacterium]